MGTSKGPRSPPQGRNKTSAPSLPTRPSTPIDPHPSVAICCHPRRPSSLSLYRSSRTHTHAHTQRERERETKTERHRQRERVSQSQSRSRTIHTCLPCLSTFSALYRGPPKRLLFTVSLSVWSELAEKLQHDRRRYCRYSSCLVCLTPKSLAPQSETSLWPNRAFDVSLCLLHGLISISIGSETPHPLHNTHAARRPIRLAPAPITYKLRPGIS